MHLKVTSKRQVTFPKRVMEALRIRQGDTLMLSDDTCASRDGLGLITGVVFFMSTLAEIEEVLPRLTVEELMRVESLLHKLQRQRHGGVLYDDTYGLWTEDDQASVAAEACDVLDSKSPVK